jgi:hypothetical protein
MVSGCTNNGAGPEPFTPTPSPTVVIPTPEPGPYTIGIIKSNQLTVSDVKIAYNRGKERQAEDFTILLVNTGSTPVKNAVLSIRVTDAQTGEYYFGDQFNVGEIPGKGSKYVNLTTDSHDYTFSITVDMDMYWGENLEFKNTFIKSYSLAYVPWT